MPEDSLPSLCRVFVITTDPAIGRTERVRKTSRGLSCLQAPGLKTPLQDHTQLLNDDDHDDDGTT